MIKTWPKTETAHEKSLAPSVRMGRLCTGYMYEEYTTPEQYLALLPIIKRRIQPMNKKQDTPPRLRKWEVPQEKALSIP